MSQPKGNASRDEWAAFALAAGAPADVVEPLTRDELRDQFGAPDVDPEPETVKPERLPTSEEVTASYFDSTVGTRVVHVDPLPTSQQVSEGYLPPPPPMVADAPSVLVVHPEQ